MLDSFAFGTILCASQEGNRTSWQEFVGSSWLELTHSPEMFRGAERCDVGQRPGVASLPVIIHRSLNV